MTKSVFYNNKHGGCLVARETSSWEGSACRPGEKDRVPELGIVLEKKKRFER